MQKAKDFEEKLLQKAEDFEEKRVKKAKGFEDIEIIVQKAKDVEEQAGAELCQAQLKLWLGLFCFRLNDNSSS